MESNLNKLSNLESKILEFSSLLLQDVASLKQAIRMMEAGLNLNNSLLEDDLLFLDRVPELGEYLSELEAVSLNDPIGNRKIALLNGHRPPSASSSRTLVIATDGSVMKKSSRCGGGAASTFSERSLLNRSEEVWFPSSSTYCEILAIYLAVSAVSSSLPNVSHLLIIADSEAAILAVKQLAMRGPFLVYPPNGDPGLV